jgi:predicted nucleotidyltransferase
MSDRVAVEVFQRLKAALEGAGVPYMVTGSIVSTLYGSPRTTSDIDLVVAPTEAQLKALLASLDPKDFYVSPEAALDALSRKSMFNVLDFNSGWKFDFIIRKSRPFNLEEFNRRVELDIGGIRMHVATPEDIILSKLEWAVEGSSERQILDVADVLYGKRGALDEAYLEKWVEKLGVEPEWLKAKSIADSLPPPPSLPAR